MKQLENSGKAQIDQSLKIRLIEVLDWVSERDGLASQSFSLGRLDSPCHMHSLDGST